MPPGHIIEPLRLCAPPFSLAVCYIKNYANIYDLYEI